jgi:hypothetical protein
MRHAHELRAIGTYRCALPGGPSDRAHHIEQQAVRVSDDEVALPVLLVANLREDLSAQLLCSGIGLVDVIDVNGENERVVAREEARPANVSWFDFMKPMFSPGSSGAINWRYQSSSSTLTIMSNSRT